MLQLCRKKRKEVNETDRQTDRQTETERGRDRERRECKGGGRAMEAVGGGGGGGQVGEKLINLSRLTMPTHSPFTPTRPQLFFFYSL